MFKQSDSPSKLGLAALALLLPVCAWAGVSTSAAPAEAPQPAVVVEKADKAPKAAVSYQIRCWQMGRLLFEENQVSLPADGGPFGGVKIGATDRNGRPVQVAETKNATCLIRSVEAEPAWPR